MRLRPFLPGFILVFLMWPGVRAAGQSPAPAARTVPPFVAFAGAVPGLEGPVTATFSLYAEATGGEALWAERQTFTLAPGGRFVVLLGATEPNGLPADLFTAGAARWVGVRADGQDEAPRILLTSAAYALKAEDASTIGGKALSAFVLVGERTGTADDGLTYLDPTTLSRALAGAFEPTANAGTANYIGMFTSTTDLGNSAMYQSGTSIGVNTLAPAATLHVMAPFAPAAYFDVYNNLLGALPAVNRAARGTPSAPTAVQPNDILGGLAVRGYGATDFGPGVGQVMFRAAEAFTDSARGTYLQMTTTPTGSNLWVERLRIDPAGNVGIGTPSPAQKLSVVGTVESLIGGFKFPDGTVQTTGAMALGQNAAFGLDSLELNTTGSGNSAFGQYSLKANTAGTANTGVGYLSLGANTLGNANTAFGEESLAANVTSSFNTALGAKSLFQNTASDNTAVGYFSLYANTTGTMNTAVGSQSLSANTASTGNTAMGYYALRSLNDGNYNTAVGASALPNLTAGLFNSAFGFQSLYAAGTASYNTGFGAQTLAATTTAWLNSALGYRSLARVTSGGMNAAVGAQSLHSTTTGVGNSGMGFNALQANAGGSYNSAFGASSLELAVGDSNAAFGYQALAGVTSGVNNTGVGWGAGAGLATGNHNTFVGYSASAAGSGLSNAAAIGAHAQVAASNALVLGGTSTYAVNVGINTTAPDTRLQVVGDVKVGTAGTNGCLMNYAGSAIAGTCSSDARLKTNLRPFGPVLDRLAALRPVHYEWRVADFPSYHFGPGTQAGLIAQDVEPVFPGMVTTDDQGYKQVNYSEVPLLTLAAVGELKAENDTLKVEVGRVRAENERLRALLDAISARLARLERIGKAER